MSKRIEREFYVCPNCDTAYPEQEEAEACIRNHPFPKKLWITNAMSMKEDCAKHLFHKVLGLRNWYCPYSEWDSSDGLLGEHLYDAFYITEMLIEVNDSPPWVHILEMHPLDGIGLREKYVVKIVSTKDVVNDE